ncbi:hypothetical protein Bbelb_236190 [Branchiostoma belcheri]|nr:hypothetical protein Bbelb_236190 [Branchiostoma belcheri]
MAVTDLDDPRKVMWNPTWPPMFTCDVTCATELERPSFINHDQPSPIISDVAGAAGLLGKPSRSDNKASGERTEKVAAIAIADVGFLTPKKKERCQCRRRLDIQPLPAMLTALLLERILRHKVVDPFPEEGTYHDRWYRDRRRRRVNAQWHRRLLSPTRDRGRKAWCRPEPPALVVTDEDGREYRHNIPSFKPLSRDIETPEDYRVEESISCKHLLQVPGKGADKTYLNSSSKASRHGGVALSEEGKSRLNVSYVDKESRRFDRNYEDNDFLTSVGQGERRENTARENHSHGDGYRLHETSINVTSKKSAASTKGERGHEAHLKKSSSKGQSQGFGGRYAGEESVLSEGHRHRTKEREISARENSHDDKYRLRHTSINKTSRQSTLLTTEERQERSFDRRYAEQKSVPSVGQPDKAVERENNYDDEYRLRHTPIIPTARHDTEPFSKEIRSHTEVSFYEREQERFDRNYIEEEGANSRGQGNKDGGRQSVGSENKHGDDLYRSRHSTSKQSLASPREERKPYSDTSSYERQEQHFDKQYVEEEVVASNVQGRYTVTQPESTRNNGYGLVHTTSRQTTASHTEEHKLYREQSSYERQEQRFDKQYVEGRHTVNQPESTRNNDYGLVHTTSRQTTASDTEEHKSYREQSSCERKEQRFDVHTTPGQNTTSLTKEHKSYLETSSIENKEQRYDDFVPSTGQRHITAKESERVQNNNYGDENRLVDTTSKYRAESRNEERESYLETSSYESQRHRTETHQEEEISVPSSSQDDHTVKEPERVLDKSYSSTTFKHSTVSSNEEHRSNLDGSFCEIHGCPFGHFSGQQDTAKDWEIHDYGDGYRLRHKAMRALAEEIKELLAEIRTSRVQTSTSTFERYQQQRSDRYDLQEDVVHSMSQGGKTEELEYNDGDRYRLRNTPTHEEDIKDGTTFCDDVSHGKHITRTSGVSEVRVTEESVGYEDLLQDEGNQRQKASHSSSETSKHITVSVDEERKTHLETTANEKQGQRHRGEEEFEPTSRGQWDKDGGRENNNSDGFSLRHTPISTISDNTTASPTEDHKAYTEESLSERESFHHSRQVEEEEKEEECWHSKCQHGRAVDWETLARENDKNGNKSRLIRVPIKVALREVYTDKWRQYMNVCQESEVGTTDSDEKSTHAGQKDHETYVSERKINLIKETGDAWREQHPQGKNGEPSTEGDLEGEYKVRRREGEDSRYTSVFEHYNEDAWQDTEDSRHISVFEDNEGEDEESWQQKQGKSTDDSLSYTSQRRLEEETEESRHRSVFENDHREEEGRNAFFEEWSSLRYTEVSAADFAEWSWLLTTDPRAREDLSEDGEASYDNSSADYLAKRRQRLMDIVDGLDEEQLSRLEWFLRQVCLLEEDVNHSLDRRSFDFSEFRADLEFVARTYFDIELRDLEMHDSRHDYLSDEDTDLETIPESDHEYDADDDGYEMSPSPAPLTSSRVDLHNISTTKGLKRWDSKDSAIGSSVGGTLRSWGSQSTVDGASESSGYRLSLDSDVFYFGDMSKYGRRSFGSTPYLSRESYC